MKKPPTKSQEESLETPWRNPRKKNPITSREEFLREFLKFLEDLERISEKMPGGIQEEILERISEGITAEIIKRIRKRILEEFSEESRE